MILDILPNLPAPPPFTLELQAARNGDALALERLTERFYPTVQRLVHLKLARDLRVARPWLSARFSTGDVVQEVFQGVLRDLSAFKGKTADAFTGYLAMVVRNRLIDAIRFHEAERRDGRRGTSLVRDDDLESLVEDPAVQVELDEQHDRLRAILEAFDAPTQLLLRARFEGTATFAELAEQLGYETEAGARHAFYAAQARLTLLLKDE